MLKFVRTVLERLFQRFSMDILGRGKKVAVAIYLQVGSVPQHDLHSELEKQRRELWEYADRQNWRIVETYADVGKSGADFSRPEFQRMISDASKTPKPFDAILVRDYFRFSRHLPEGMRYEARLKECGVEIWSATQPPEALQLMRAIAAAFDEHTSAAMSRRVSRAMMENARQGFWNGSPAPFGYETYVAEVHGRHPKKKIRPRDGEARLVKRIFSIYLAGNSLRAIATSLNSRGKHVRGKPLTAGTVNRILRNSVYAGTYHFNRGGRGNAGHQLQDGAIPVACAAIVPLNVFERVQTLLNRNARRNRLPAHNGGAAFSDFREASANDHRDEAD